MRNFFTILPYTFNPLLTSMSMASPVILKIIDRNEPPAFHRRAAFSYFFSYYTRSSLIYSRVIQFSLS